MDLMDLMDSGIQQKVQVGMCARRMHIRAVWSESWMGVPWVTKFRRKTKTLVRLCIGIFATYTLCWLGLLTHLCLKGFPTLINWASPFPIKGLLSGILPLFSNFDRTFCKQIVKSLIRRHVLRRLIWFCTACCKKDARFKWVKFEQ